MNQRAAFMTVDFIKRKGVRFWGGINGMELAGFYRQMATMVNAGVPLLRCIDVLEGQVRNPVLRDSVNNIRRGLMQGFPLWKSMSQSPEVFSTFHTQMVASGEAGGFLGASLEKLAFHQEKETEFSNRIRSAALYPMIVGLFTLVVLVFLASFVIPQFAAIFREQGVELPLVTRVILQMGSTIINYGWMLLLGLLVLSLLIIKWRSSNNGRLLIDRLFLDLPIIGSFVKKTAAARITGVMGTLVQSGIPVVDSLTLAASLADNRVITKSIERAAMQIYSGQDITAPLTESRVFEAMAIQMIAVGEESGSLGEVLNKLSEYYESEVNRLMGTTVALLEPALVVFLALIVGLIMASNVMPMLDLMNSLW
ncbi:MAG: type II secretion system F family protein [Candidatus Saccharibacteria bacterium]